jgi:hypothetical protein
MRLSLFAALAAMLGPGCATTAEAVPPSSPGPGAKQTAPVTIDAQLTPGHAQVTLRFEAPASRVSAGVKGLDGLEVTSPGPLGKSAFQAGETATLEVPLRSASGTLAVFVSGSFAGNPWSRAVSFAVGPGASDSEPGVVQTDQGPVRAVPVPSRK